MRTIIKSNIKQINVLDECFYTEDEKTFYPSATEILSIYPKGFGFDQWQRDVGNNAKDIAQRAAEIGSKLHAATERIDAGLPVTMYSGETDNFTLQEWEMICCYVDFKNALTPKLVSNEFSICSSKLGFGGTLDRVFEFHGRRWLIDIKTSNYIHKSHELQVAAYAKLWNERFPEAQVDLTGILWLKSNTRTSKIDRAKLVYQGIFERASWQLKSFDRHYNESFKIFQHTQNIWKEENPNPKPANYKYPTEFNVVSVKENGVLK